MAKKIYVLDTSACLTNANVIYKYGNNDIAIPLKVFDEFYKNELFIDVMEKDACPQTKSVTASNICRISVHKVPNSNKLVILSVIDNLIKGASGQAVQNMNIMMRWPEKLGLNLIPLTP